MKTNINIFYRQIINEHIDLLDTYLLLVCKNCYNISKLKFKATVKLVLKIRVNVRIQSVT